MSSSIFRRTTIGAVAIAGALSLAACNSDNASVSTSSAPSASSSTAAPTTTSQSSAPETSTSAATTPSTTTTSTQQSAPPVSGPTAVSPDNATYKIGQPAVIKDDDGTYRLTPTSLEVAPASAYTEANLNKANGTVYYLKFDVTAINPNATYFGTNSVNGLFFHPEIGASVKNAKRLYGDTKACTSNDTKLAAGQSGSSCYIYQIPGATVSNVVFNDYQHNIRWTK